MKTFLTVVPQKRTFAANATLAVVLCATAGALNAGGFFVTGVFTSHVTGSVARIGDEIATGHLTLAWRFAAYVCSFLFGAMSSTYLIESYRGPNRGVAFGKALVLELLVVIAYATLGYASDGPAYRGLENPYALALGVLLSFAMGAQNAMVTKISGAVVRTTHMTGIVTDFGIETVRLTLLLRDRMSLPKDDPNCVDSLHDSYLLLRAESQKALLHLVMFWSFAGGALAGALSFARWDYLGVVPPAIVLATLAAIDFYLVKLEREEQAGERALAKKSATRRFAARAFEPTTAAPPAAPSAPSGAMTTSMTTTTSATAAAAVPAQAGIPGDAPAPSASAAPAPQAPSASPPR